MRACTCVAAASVLLLAPGLLEIPASGQTERKLSAREIFYSAPKAAAVARKPTARMKKPPKEVAVTVATAAVEKEPVKEVASVAAPKPIAPPVKDIQQPAPPASSEKKTQFIHAAEETKVLVPLGLRYSILKRVGPDDLVEVDSEIVFRAGDRIRLRVEVNDKAYLYIIHRGSSGIWKPLFPSSEIAGGGNIVSPGHPDDIPPGYVFTFDEQPGEEKLFLVASRQPETDLENLIYRLSRGEGQAAPSEPAETAPSKPGEEAAPKAKLLLAHNLVNINDSFVDRLRNAYARDLIIEKVDQNTPGSRKETAVYTVAPAADPDSRVVVDVSLHHR